MAQHSGTELEPCLSLSPSHSFLALSLSTENNRYVTTLDPFMDARWILPLSVSFRSTERKKKL